MSCFPITGGTGGVGSGMVGELIEIDVSAYYINGAAGAMAK